MVTAVHGTLLLASILGSVCSGGAEAYNIAAEEL